ncbi:MAG TPA: AlkA N-terminal domain-containing protein [Candidatus Limnocylindria bacterium]|nr:AlkA N-terminal domain-containing protein [Candidatus Limnocylindria bacterium]
MTSTVLAEPLGSLDPERLHRAVDSRDPRFDGQVYLGVTSTGIYCRPSCPARRPKRENRRFYASAAAAVAAGYRACRLCRPDSLPGSRAWDHRGDLAARALRLIGAGHVDEQGVAGLATTLHVSERQLHRVLLAEVGAGALRLARSRRAQTARLLIDQTDLTLNEIAFASGFASVRQFNDVMREEFGVAPSLLRRRVAVVDERSPSDGSLVLRLRLREPYAGTSLVRWWAVHAVSGLEEVVDGGLGQVVRTPHGPAVVRSRPELGHLVTRISLPDLGDLAGTVAGLRRMWDLDTDPVAVDTALSQDPLLAPLVAARPGLRVPGSVDGFEAAARAVLGQQVSVRTARTMTARVVERHGQPLTDPVEGLTRAFPSPEALADADLEGLGLVGSRARALRALAAAVARGLRLDAGADREAVRSALLALPGIGAWTADVVALRALGDPDAWLPTDLVLRRAVERRSADPERWRPWRAYAAVHLWTHDALEAS